MYSEHLPIPDHSNLRLTFLQVALDNPLTDCGDSAVVVQAPRLSDYRQCDFWDSVDVSLWPDYRLEESKDVIEFSERFSVALHYSDHFTGDLARLICKRINTKNGSELGLIHLTGYSQGEWITLVADRAKVNLDLLKAYYRGDTYLVRLERLETFVNQLDPTSTLEEWLPVEDADNYMTGVHYGYPSIEQFLEELGTDRLNAYANFAPLN